MPHALIIGGYGLNCEDETKYALELACATATVVHVNDLIGNRTLLDQCQILVVPGGFSYGDDTGAGNALANKLRNNLNDELLAFVDRDTLTIGICNGFQVLARLGLVPAIDQNYGVQQVSLTHNSSARYIDRWVDLTVENESPWLADIDTLSLPIAHGEGRFYCDDRTLELLKSEEHVALRYDHGEICSTLSLPHNPNGSLDDIAAITDETGRILGMMPHPERAIAFTHLPHWTLLREQYRRAGTPLPEEGPGLKLFRNAVNYFD